MTAAATLRDGAAYDVVVVGSGAAGLAAAVTAACKGLRVAVLEKAPVFGGTTAISGGGVWIPCNHLAAKAGIVDSPELAMRYFEHCAGERLDVPLVDAFLRNGPEMLRYFEQHTEVRFSYAQGRPDYRPDGPGAAREGRTIHPLPFDARRLGAEVSRLRPPSSELTFLGMMIKPGPELKHFLNVFRSVESTVFVTRKLLRHFRDLAVHRRAMDLSNGNALIGRLAKSAFDHGVALFTDVQALALVRQEGRVCGLDVRCGGRDVRVTARHGVVLASGGFSHDAERRRQLFPHAARGHEHCSPGVLTVTGDGLRMAEAAQAHIRADLSNAACWAPVSRVPQADGSTVTIPHLIDRQKPGFIAVTRHGRRFVNEANSYHDFGQAMVAACADDDETSVWLLADHATLRRYGMGGVKPAPLPFAAHLRSGYLLTAESWEALAAQAGIDAGQLVQTIAEFNRHAVRGEDPAFGKGANIYNRYNGDPGHQPNPCVAPLDKGPFYAMKLHIGELGTLAGLAIDAQARVLDTAGAPIPGLYAAGNDAANLMGGDYMSGGSTLGPGMVFGYIAGSAAAAAAGSGAAAPGP